MAAAPSQRPSQRPRSNAQRVFETYVAECTARGKWGAFKRTGERYGKSDEWARKIVHRHLKQAEEQPPELAPDLAYVPCPGEIEYAQDCAKRAAQIANDELLRKLLEPDLPNSVSSPCLDIRQEPNVETPNSQLPTEPIYQLPQYKPVGYDPTANYQQLAWIALACALLITFGVILVASKSLGLALALFPEAMGMWWVVVQARRRALRVV